MTIEKQLVAITSGSIVFLALKTGLVALMNQLTNIEAWLNYLIVSLLITVCGWLYHSKISFRRRLTMSVLYRYCNQAVALKALDYAVYNGLVYGMGINVILAVPLTSGMVFVTRVIVYFKYVFRAGPCEGSPEARKVQVYGNDG